MEPSKNQSFPHLALQEIAKMERFDESKSKLPQLYVDGESVHLKIEEKVNSFFSWIGFGSYGPDPDLEPGLTNLPSLLTKTIKELKSELYDTTNKNPKLSESLNELKLAYSSLNHLNDSKELDQPTKKIISQALKDIRDIEGEIQGKIAHEKMLDKLGKTLYEIDPLLMEKFSNDEEFKSALDNMNYEIKDTDIQNLKEMAIKKTSQLKIKEQNESILIKLYDDLVKIDETMAEDVMNNEELINNLSEGGTRVIEAQDIENLISDEIRKKNRPHLENLTAKLIESGLSRPFFELLLKDEEWKNKIDTFNGKLMAPQDVENLVKLANNKMDSIVVAMTNEPMLIKLYEALCKIDEDVAEEIFNNEELILGLSNNNTKFINDADIENFVSIEKTKERPVKIKKEVKTENKPNEILENLENRLAVDLPANIEVIKKAFPEIEAFLKVLPKDDIQLRNIDLLIKKAIVLQSIKNPHFKEDSQVTILLEAMGLESKKNNENFNYDLKEILNQDNFDKLTLSQVEEAVWNQQLYLKFKQAGGKEEDKKILLPLYKFQNEFKMKMEKEILSTMNNFIDNDPEFQNFPVYRKYFLNELPELIDSAVSQRLPTKQAYKVLMKAIEKDPTLDVDKFLQDLSVKWETRAKEISNSRIESLKNSLKKQLEWYKDWGKYLSKELIQGSEDEQEIFTEGVCLAMTMRLNVMEQKNAMISNEELANNIVIKPTDRYNQAYYKMAKISRVKEEENDILKNFNQIHFTKSLLSRNNIKETETLFDMQMNSFDMEWLENPEIASALRKTKGLLNIGISGHALLMRLDEERKIYHFFDPNVGLTKNFESAEQMIQCFNSLLAATYPDNELLRGTCFYL